jgi:hypothetical protein
LFLVDQRVFDRFLIVLVVFNNSHRLVEAEKKLNKLCNKLKKLHVSRQLLAAEVLIKLNECAAHEAYSAN